jgi:hypothetical protein
VNAFRPHPVRGALIVLALVLIILLGLVDLGAYALTGLPILAVW